MMLLCLVVLVDNSLISLLFVFLLDVGLAYIHASLVLDQIVFYFLILLWVLVFSPSLSLSYVQKLQEQNQSVIVESEGTSPC